MPCCGEMLRCMIARQIRSTGGCSYADTYGSYKMISNASCCSVSTVKYKHNYI